MKKKLAKPYLKKKKKFIKNDIQTNIKYEKINYTKITQNWEKNEQKIDKT